MIGSTDISGEAKRVSPKMMAVAVLIAGVVAATILLALANPAQAAFRGESGQIAFVSERDDSDGEIYTMNEDGTNTTRLTNNPAFDALPSFSPDGKKVAFTSRRDINDEIYVTDPTDLDGDGNGENLTRITNTSSNEFQPAFSPDGERMVFTSNQNGNEIYMMDADGTNRIRLTNNVARDARPAFSPKGDRVAFTSNRDGDDEIYMMDAKDIDGDGNGDYLTKLTNNTGVIDTHANFSPDGERVAFTSNLDGDFEIYVTHADGGGNSTRLTDNQGVVGLPNLARDEFPAFSPDGSRIAFSSGRDGNFEIYTMDAADENGDGNGDNPKRLTNDPETDSKPDWGPTPEVPVDIKPEGCPNPLNTDEEGVLPVAVLGTDDFDATQIDPASVELEGVSSLRSDSEDVATPFEPLMGKKEVTDCIEAGPDGFEDLTLKFDTQEVVKALGTIMDDEVRVLKLAGNLKPEFGGTPVIGEDVVVVT